MKIKAKKHLGFIIFLIIILVFPVSLSYQARLNMRIIVTGLAIDKIDNEYQVTAQIVKTIPGSKPPGTSAEIDFLVDRSKVLSEAVSKLAYKAGKVSAFSHTNFIIVGKSVLEEDISKCLDYFVRDKVIKNSALLLFTEDSAGDELQKTKKTELSVGIGLQKVYTFKERNSDGLMVTIIDFLKNSKSNTGTSVASTLALETNKEQQSSSGSSGGEGDSSSGSGSGSGEQGSSSSGGSSGSGSSSGEGGSSGGGSSGGEEYQYFKQNGPLMCFVDGRFAGKIESEDDVSGFMLAHNKSKVIEVTLSDVSGGRFHNDQVEIAIRNKNNKFKISYQGDVPVLEVLVTITKSEIGEILSDKIIGTLTEEEYGLLVQKLKEEISKKVTACFETAKGFGVDIFNAYDYAYKYKYKNTTNKYSDKTQFLNDVQIKVSVDIKQMDY